MMLDHHTPGSDPDTADRQDRDASAPRPIAADAAAAEDTQAPSAELVKAALRKVKDPELNLNVVDLGLIYDVAVDGRNVKVDMSLTSPACPSGAELTSGVEQAARGVEGVEDVSVNIVWEPMWTPDRIEPRIRTYLGF